MSHDLVAVQATRCDVKVYYINFSDFMAFYFIPIDFREERKVASKQLQRWPKPTEGAQNKFSRVCSPGEKFWTRPEEEVVS